MKHLFNDLPKEEKNRILELHTKNQSIIKEALGEGPNTTSQPNKEVFSNTKVMTAGNELFKTGSAEIDKNSQALRVAVGVLGQLPEGTQVEIQGGASRVGEKQGYNNIALAQKRAKNFIQAVYDSGVKGLKFVTIKPVVGGSDVPESREALDAQFVKYSYPDSISKVQLVPAIDNTAVQKALDYKIIKPSPIESHYLCKFEIEYDPKVISVKMIKKTIENSLAGKVVSVKNLKYSK